MFTRAPRAAPKRARNYCRSTAAERSPPRCFLVDSTLREGEQFANASFRPEDRRRIAQYLSNVGVDYIEMTNPVASRQASADITAVASMNLRPKVVAHVRCKREDIAAASSSGASGVNIFLATSSLLRSNSHGKDIQQVIEQAQQAIEYARDHQLEVRFSTEDTFRSNLEEVISIYKHVAKMGVHRVGIADTVGIATPTAVARLVSRVRSEVTCDIEFHGHNDTGCAIANAFTAFEAGATHIDTTVLGIGERNGIASLGGFIARLVSLDPATKSCYDLRQVAPLENFVAKRCNIDVPFNNIATGSAAFVHKAGVHLKAVLQNPQSYEILNPEDFGTHRTLQVATRLTGWHAIKAYATSKGLTLPDADIKKLTQEIKEWADQKELTNPDIDALLWRAAVARPANGARM